MSSITTAERPVAVRPPRAANPPATDKATWVIDLSYPVPVAVLRRVPARRTRARARTRTINVLAGLTVAVSVADLLLLLLS